MVMVALALLPGGLMAAAGRSAERLLAGLRVLLLPLAPLVAFRLWLEPALGETHMLVNDWYLHAEYGLMFALGALLARSDALWVAVVRHRHFAAAMAVAGFAAMILARGLWPDGAGAPVHPAWVAERTGQACQAWGAIVALLGYARLHLDRDDPARRYLTEAVFPFYVAHQTIIVLVAYWLRPWDLPASAEFGVLTAATIAGCLLFHEAARRSGPLRPLFGLARERTSAGKERSTEARPPVDPPNGASSHAGRT